MHAPYTIGVGTSKTKQHNPQSAITTPSEEEAAGGGGGGRGEQEQERARRRREEKEVEGSRPSSATLAVLFKRLRDSSQLIHDGSALSEPQETGTDLGAPDYDEHREAG